MKSNWLDFHNYCKKFVNKVAEDVVEKATKYIERDARRNFNRAVVDVPADDPYVVVNSASMGSVGIVSCYGNQVLFIEFGAGIKLHDRTSTRMFVDNVKTEIAPRPAGIVGIGEYGKHYGKGDYWFYRSETGRGSMNAEQIRYNPNVNSYTMITIGIRPTRSLYLATFTGLRKALNKK